MRPWLIALIALCLTALSPGLAQAREDIRSFVVDIEVRADAAVEVTETITVNAEGVDIRRGIFRDIPLRALDEWGLWSDNGFELMEVRHNGAPAPHRTEWIDRFLRIYIGDAEVFIPHGVHTYTIRYVTTRQLRFFDDFDEFYWNVTGNFWSFPILSAEARVRLPAGARALELAAYTGGFGADGTDYRASGKGGSAATFTLTRPLAPQEGMTVAVAFTPGVVTPDTAGFFGMLGSNIGIFMLILGWIGVPAYYAYAWNKVGRDPPAPPMIPLFHPPENLSPAALSYAHYNGFQSGGRGSDLAFIAALLSLGVKRLLRIEEDRSGGISVVRGTAAETGQPSGLPGGEQALFSGLLANREEMTFDKHNGPAIQKAQQALRSAISTEYGGRYYNANIGWFVLGVLLAVVTFVLGLILQAPPEDGVVALIPVLMTSIFGGVLGFFGFGQFNRPGAGFFMRMLGAAMMAAGVALFGLGVVIVLSADGLPVYQFAAALIAVGAVVILMMAKLLGAPTKVGAKVLTDIEGFKLYLETAESNRLNLRDAPEMSEELFERFLPYAAGLGVEKPWSQAWQAHLARVAPERQDDFKPEWYHGRSWSPGDIGAATASSVAAVSAAMAASMPQPKSSSGSGGGGSSGGGGGGGGGGGW
ncbi:DUF2207 domain-containing protein [uncultured Hoeflea sp.]|uniref:DUF2207 domain-containing protein n=1 Tax=uncultured Hoeflea sp. TaxID=538666 RepID=UPI00260CBA18|nr:DUF2207 domain-containing protein [uncultured Hoeflea sp.]